MMDTSLHRFSSMQVLPNEIAQGWLTLCNFTNIKQKIAYLRQHESLGIGQHRDTGALEGMEMSMQTAEKGADQDLSGNGNYQAFSLMHS